MNCSHILDWVDFGIISEFFKNQEFIKYSQKVTQFKEFLRNLTILIWNFSNWFVPRVDDLLVNFLNVFLEEVWLIPNSGDWRPSFTGIFDWEDSSFELLHDWKILEPEDFLEIFFLLENLFLGFLVRSKFLWKENYLETSVFQPASNPFRYSYKIV